jgi:hypothetical protein
MQSTHTQAASFRSILILISHQCVSFQVAFPFQTFQLKFIFSMRATWFTHFILLGLIARRIFVDSAAIFSLLPWFYLSASMFAVVTILPWLPWPPSLYSLWLTRLRWLPSSPWLPCLECIRWRIPLMGRSFPVGTGGGGLGGVRLVLVRLG